MPYVGDFGMLGTMDEPKDRLKRARLRAGFGSAAKAAERFGWPYTTYAAHENGQNGLRPDSVLPYAKAFKVSAAWILTGEGPGPNNMVPLRGYVGAGAVIMPAPEHENLEYVEPPLGITEPIVAVKVRGSSMEPAYFDGDLIFYNPETDGRSPEDLINRECIIRLNDGRMLLKRIKPSPLKGRFMLISYNSDPIPDARIEWAVPVRFIQRA